MIWNNEFLNASPSVFDGILQSETDLSDILFQEDLLQELKTSNINLTQYLIKPEIMTQLIDNITQLTERDCFDKLLYSRVHAAYISCEILTVGSSDISDALLASPNSLNKIISCLVREQPKQNKREEQPEEPTSKKHEGETNSFEPSSLPSSSSSSPDEPKAEDEKKVDSVQSRDTNEPPDAKQEGDENKEEETPVSDSQETTEKVALQNGCTTETTTTATAETPLATDEVSAALSSSSTREPSSPKPEDSSSPKPSSNENNDDDENSHKQVVVPLDKIKVVPQKATLISKLISNIHSQAPADLSCYITKNIETFSELIQVLVNNIDVSGSFEILSTFINRTNPPELRYVFCEILSKLNFVFSLMNVMTLSNVEDKQRNACQLLCDIIVIGRQEATEQTGNGPSAQDMLAELIVSREAVHLMLKQMFSHKACEDVMQFKPRASKDNPNEVSDGHESKEEEEKRPATDGDDDPGQVATNELASAGADTTAQATEAAEPNKTAIICGMKILQTLVEQKVNNSHANNNHVQNNISLVARTIEQIQDEIAENLVNFHELLLNPPKQEPIKTTFGVIQKPLGFIRLEVVNLIRALLGTFSPVIIKKLVELRTMKVIIDLFVDYSWNNLLHTQVEQAVTYIIKNCRRDEDLKYQIDMQKHTTNHITEDSTNQLTLQQNQQLQHQHQNREERELQEQQAGGDNENNEQQQQQQKPLQQNGITNGIESKTNELQVAAAGDDGPSAAPNESGAGDRVNGVADSAQTPPTLANGPASTATASDNNAQATTTTTITTTSNEKTTSNDDELPSLALLSQLLNECDLIGRLLMPKESGEKANFGHIIQMINSIAISCDLDTIQEHLNEMKDKRPELHARWTTFVNVDVASFKEISLYYDVQSVNNHTDNNYEYLQRRNQPLASDQHGYYLNSSPNHHNSRPNHMNHAMSNSSESNVAAAAAAAAAAAKSMNGNGDDHLTAYFSYLSFTKETVIPSINVDVLPKSRGSITNKNTPNY